ncbi:GDP-L-fucose synthase [Ruficoccus sp. ZRK36]|uniref:GDP-L-fucose synthase family protein n=1 Tax=Ruficoccus sp. ZRK36 TaxID=2866311 RepID=UPI001C734A6A|nr:GDP-L-fucose synthase [Ruficoccus sp. ZRK36]QYY36594.1 GDP-L-fucose synthase [Ruficoccus sp. ZRK36]
MNPDSKIFLSGHRGMVGSAIHRALLADGHDNFVLRTHAELDLCDAGAVEETLAEEKPETVIVAAARVGGIHANSTYPAEFIHENLASAHNMIHLSWKHGVKRLLFLGSSCIYPREAPQPMTEDCLLTSPLEPTNEPYAIAKIAGLKLCQYYRKQYGVLYHSAMPTNLYGPGDNYHPENSHVLPALLRRFHEAVESGAPDVTLWGTGSPLREFLHVDDLAAGCLHLLELDNPPDWVNVGFGSDVTIKELAETVRDVTGFQGELKWDTSKPDGTPRKLMDSSKIRATGWEPKIGLREGIEKTYAHFKQELAKGNIRG